MQTAKVLLIEDNSDLSTFYSVVLKSRGYDVTLAVDGQDGIKRLGETAYDVVVTDLTMPDMSIEEYISALAKSKESRPFACIIISGREDMDKWSKMLGACKFLRKPIDIITLTREISSTLKTN